MEAGGGGCRNKQGSGCKFRQNKKKRAICKYEYNYNNNKVKNYTVDNVIVFNNKTIGNIH